MAQTQKQEKFEHVLVGHDSKGNFSLFYKNERDEAIALPFDTTQALKKEGLLSIDFKRGILENFLSNFKKQFAQPTLQRIFTVPFSNISESIKKLSSLIEKGDYESRQTLGKFMVLDDFPPENGKMKLTTRDINWEEMNKIGVSLAYLMSSGELSKLLSGNKSSVLSISIPYGEDSIHTQARLYLKNSDNGYVPGLIPIRHSVELDKPYMGHTFSEEEKSRLLETGHLGCPFIKKDENGNEQRFLVSIDWETNTLSSVPQSRIFIPERLGERVLSPTEQSNLRDGRSIRVEMINKEGKPYVANVQYDANKRELVFSFDKNEIKEQQRITRPDEIQTLCKHLLSQDEKEKLIKGEQVFITGMIDKSGKEFDAFVIWDKESRRVRYSSKGFDENGKSLVRRKKETQLQKKEQKVSPPAPEKSKKTLKRRM